MMLAFSAVAIAAATETAITATVCRELMAVSPTSPRASFRKAAESTASRTKSKLFFVASPSFFQLRLIFSADSAESSPAELKISRSASPICLKGLSFVSTSRASLSFSRILAKSTGSKMPDSSLNRLSICWISTSICDVASSSRLPNSCAHMSEPVSSLLARSDRALAASLSSEAASSSLPCSSARLRRS